MNLVTVHSSPNLQELQMVKAMLEQENIDSSILDENVATIAPHLTFAQEGMRLAVIENDAQRALEIITDYFDSTGK